MYKIIIGKLNSFTSYVDPYPSSLHSAPKRILIIQAHPVEKSFSNSILESVVKGVTCSGTNSIRVRNLYCYDKDHAKNCYGNTTFNPVLTYSERLNYHDHESTNLRSNEETYNQVNDSPDIKQAVADLRWCDSIIFIYPTWWFNLPAILKGYFDRVFLPGVAFRLPESPGPLIPGLSNIKKIGVVSTYGATHPIVFYCGDNGRRFISKGLRPIMASDCQLQWCGLYDMDNKTEIERKEFLTKIELLYKDF